MSSEFLITAEAADALRISPRTLERMRQAGTGPRFLKAGRRILYRECDLADWLNQNCFSSTSEATRGVTS